MKMLAKRKLDLTPSRVERIDDVKKNLPGIAMPDTNSADFSYFPGCSLATTAKESNQSLIECCRKMGINLVELADWKLLRQLIRP